MITPSWATTFALLALMFVLGILGWMSWKLRQARDEITELEIKLRTQGHVCRPPAWAGKGPHGWLQPMVGAHWVCTCTTRFVLTRTFRPRPDGPFRLGWITEIEHATGNPPPWVHQEPESRLEHHPGVHRREGAL